MAKINKKGILGAVAGVALAVVSIYGIMKKRGESENAALLEADFEEITPVDTGDVSESK